MAGILLLNPTFSCLNVVFPLSLSLELRQKALEAFPHETCGDKAFRHLSFDATLQLIQLAQNSISLFQLSNPPALLPQLEIYHTFFIFHQKYSNGLRFTTIVLCGTLSVMGSKYLEFPSAGALGCITASFTAGTGWRRQKAKNAAFNCNVEMYLNLLWKFLKPVSFSLIGKEVDFQVLTGSVLLYGFLTLLIGVVFRLVSGYLSFCGGNMNWKEKAYITLSGFPKATGKTERFVVICSMSKISHFFFPERKKISSSRSWTRCFGLGTIPKCLQRGTAFASKECSSDFSSGNHFNCSIRYKSKKNSRGDMKGRKKF
jgi:hypothetical protein